MGSEALERRGVFRYTDLFVGRRARREYEIGFSNCRRFVLGQVVLDSRLRGNDELAVTGLARGLMPRAGMNEK